MVPGAMIQVRTLSAGVVGQPDAATGQHRYWPRLQLLSEFPEQTTLLSAAWDREPEKEWRSTALLIPLTTEGEPTGKVCTHYRPHFQILVG
jgi:hypothetical protein